MGQTCCNLDNKVDSVFKEEDFYLSYETPELDLETLKFVKSRNLEVWRKRQSSWYYCGNWENGLAEGEGCCFQQNSLSFVGNFQRGRLNGKGVICFAKRAQIYEGQFLQGQAHGKGKLTNKNQNMEFTGDWFCSRAISGIITFLDPNSRIESVEISDSNSKTVKIVLRNKSEYSGEVNEDWHPNGQGVLLYPQNSEMTSYEGQWDNGVFHGKGRYVWKDGSEYIGSYSSGKKQGQGKFIFASKRYYSGKWLGGLKNGRGSLHEVDGKVIKQGIWQKGNFIMSLSEQEMNNQSQKA